MRAEALRWQLSSFILPPSSLYQFFPPCELAARGCDVASPGMSNSSVHASLLKRSAKPLHLAGSRRGEFGERRPVERDQV